jgi:ABC-type sugar transport system substrate-binding protein
VLQGIARYAELHGPWSFYYEDRGLRYSQQRQEAFVDRFAAAGFPAFVFATREGDQEHALKMAEQRGQAGQRDLMAWLAELPKPIGLMACNDLRGQQVLNACRESGIEVPDQIAVIGVDDGEIVCRLSEAPDRQWQLNTVTDSHDRQMKFHYQTQQVAGRWVVNQIELPSADEARVANYTYDDLHLTRAGHAVGQRMAGVGARRLDLHAVSGCGSGA